MRRPSSTQWILGLTTGLCLLTTSLRAEVAVCPQPYQAAGTAWCDGDPTRYLGNTFCLVEPVGDADTQTIDEEILGAGACLLGKFKDQAAFEQLIDFVISYEGLPPPNATPEEVLNTPAGIIVPSLGTLVATLNLLTTIPMEQEGTYDISIRSSILSPEGNLQDLPVINRRLLRLAKPHLTIKKARVGGSNNDCGAADPTCLTVAEIAGDSDGDGICDGAAAIAGLCTPGPDLQDDNGADPAPHAIQVSSPATKATGVEFCIQPDDEAGNAGNEIVIEAINHVSDASQTPAKTISLTATCVPGGDTLCQANESSDTFCPGGYSITVPVAHGTNSVELYVNNKLTGYDAGAAETIDVLPFDVDLRGPALCVRYLNEDGVEIPNVDGKVLLASEAEAVTIDVSAGRCGQVPETLPKDVAGACDVQLPPDCDGSLSLCLQKNNDRNDDGTPHLSALCPVPADGTTHYQIALNELRYPINTITVQARDAVGNMNVETHSFGYGSVRPLFDQQGNLDIKQAMVERGFGGFMPADYVTGELMELVLKAVNTKKFKNDVFVKLLDPRQPPDEEISCLKSIEDQVTCQYDHLANKDRITTMKLFCDDGDCSKNIGQIEVPSLYLLNSNRIRAQLKIKKFQGRAEMYTMEFLDSDHDGIVDTEDDDSDNDGFCDDYLGAIGKCSDDNADEICDEDGGVSGTLGSGLNATHKCVLDKSIAKEDCPDIDVGDKHYWGCSDQDDDNDGVPDAQDMPGRIVLDPDFGTYVIPIRLDVKEVAINLDAKVSYVDGKMHLEVTNAPGRELVEWISNGSDPIVFDCDKQVSELFQGGAADQVGNGKNLWIDTETCNGLKSLGSTDDGMGGKSIAESSARPQLCLAGDEACIIPAIVDGAERKNQDARRQFRCTFNAVLRCSTPRRAEATMAKFSNQKLIGASQELFDHNFHVDVYSPLNETRLQIDPNGIGFFGKGLLLPAGVTGKDDKAERNAVDFLKTLPAEFKTAKFGPLSPVGSEIVPDPIAVASEMGSEMNFALKEETINSLAHSVSLLVWDLANQEGDAHQSLDLDAKRLREKFEMGIPDRGDPEGLCRDESGHAVDDAPNKGFDTYKCFPFALDALQLLGDLLKYIDFDLDGILNPNADLKVPLLMRSSLNPAAAPTTRIVSATPMEAWNGTDPTRPAVIMMELEIGLGHSQMSLFEEKVTAWSQEVVHGSGEIKDWCDADRFPGMNLARCTQGQKMPIAVFNLSGRVFVTALVSIKDNGILRMEAGISSMEGDAGLIVDPDKTYINVSMHENNTIIPDQELANIFQQNVTNIIGQYVFGTARDVRINAPTELPLKDYCASHEADSPELCQCILHPEGEDCDDDLGKLLDDMWDGLDLDDFGIEGVTLETPLLGVTGEELGATRYLTIGAGTKFKFVE